MVEVREEERRNEEGTERVFVGRGRTGEGLACRRGDWGVSRCPGWERALMIGEGGRGVSGWCMQLATWLERTRRNALGGARQEEQKRTVVLCARPPPARYGIPYRGAWAGWCWPGGLGLAGVQEEIGAHDFTATTLDSCRSSSIFSHHPTTLPGAHDDDCCCPHLLPYSG